MALLTSSGPRKALLYTSCSRCLSLATRTPALTVATNPRRHRQHPRATTATQTRCYADATHSKGAERVIPYEWLKENEYANPSEPSQVPDDVALPADGKHVAIVGGGLAGLTTAYYMANAVRENTKITIYEAAPRLGGWVKTDQVPVDVGGKKGIVNFERGPRSFSALGKNKSRYDDLVFYDLCLKLGLKPHVAPNLPRYVFYPDHLVPMPESILSLLPTIMKEDLWRETLPGAAWGYLKYVLAGKPVPEKNPSITEFVQTLTGRDSKVADNLVSAVIHGIYGGDIDKLDADATLFPQLQTLTMKKLHPHTEIVSTQTDLFTLASFLGDPLVRKMAKDVAKKKGALLHFGAKGLQALPDALEEALQAQPNVTIKKSMPVRKMEYMRKDKKVMITEKNGAIEHFDKVFTTVGAETLDKLAPGKLPCLERFESVSIMAVNLWFPEPNLKPPGFGYLIPRSVKEDLNPHHALGVFFDSDIENNHPEEPEGTKLFVLMGGHHYNKPGVKIPTPDEAIIQARQLLERHLGIPMSLPCHAEANFSRDCIPQHHVGFQPLLQDLNSELETQFEGRLNPIGGAFSRIGGMAALRDGFIAGTTGLDVTKPLGQGQGDQTWEEKPVHQLMQGWNVVSVPPEYVGPVRTSVFPDMADAKPMVGMSKDKVVILANKS
ncbi:flavin containing amine oxidoreductase domain-containing protein [Sarocladium implicatum]|nr:flavin containing amine oxidoreductase domain-containing protein [Sarocladium implicatum]